MKQGDHFLKYEVRLADGIQSWARNNPESIARDGTDECDIQKSFNHVGYSAPLEKRHGSWTLTTL